MALSFVMSYTQEMNHGNWLYDIFVPALKLYFILSSSLFQWTFPATRCSSWKQAWSHHCLLHTFHWIRGSSSPTRSRFILPFASCNTVSAFTPKETRDFRWWSLLSSTAQTLTCECPIGMDTLACLAIIRFHADLCDSPQRLGWQLVALMD